MDLRLYSIERLPHVLPVWETILHDLGNPSARRIAKALGVGESTVYRWNQTGNAPKVACLALFWLTRWGRSEVDAAATNDARMAAGLVQSLTGEREALRRQLAAVAAELAHQRQVNERLRLSDGHDSAATAERCRTGTALEDSSAGGSAPQNWPDLGWPEPAAALPEPLAWPALDPAGAGPGSPAEQPPGAHSTRSPAPGHSAQPQPSVHQEVGQSWPLASEWRQSDAILAASGTPAFPLLELRQAPALRAAGAAGRTRQPSALRVTPSATNAPRLDGAPGPAGAGPTAEPAPEDPARPASLPLACPEGRPLVADMGRAAPAPCLAPFATAVQLLMHRR